MIPTDKPFCFTMRNVNIKSRSLKGGMKYTGEWEMTVEDYHALEDTNLEGIVIEVDQARITHLNDNGEPEKQQKPYADKTIGPLCREANDLCQLEGFQLFLRDFYGNQHMRKITKHYASETLKSVLGVTTKKAIDYNQAVAAHWGVITDHFKKWSERKRAAGV